MDKGRRTSRRETRRGETLYNGIRLPSTWPPTVRSLPPDPGLPPYLVHPPAIIPIDVGRQLFVDDFLIQHTTLRRRFHAAQYVPGNPILKPDRPWENGADSPYAMVFSDGVWYDPKDSLFKMWYMAGHCSSTCYGTSQDGFRWDKPSLDIVPGTNVTHQGTRDSSTVWMDLEERDPARRFKMVRSHGNGGWGLSIHSSSDGIHWSDAVAHSGSCGDRTTVFWNPFRRMWVFSLRDYEPGGMGRFRRYWENGDIVAGARWETGRPPLWTRADDLDPQHPSLKTKPELYNLDVAAYESLLIGLFSVWRGQPTDRPKINEIVVGFTRNGFHWHRPVRSAFIPVSERYGDWNWGNVQSAGGCCLVVGDRLFFYVSGRAGVCGTGKSGVCSTGLAVLRRDGFASMDAHKVGGTLTTRPIRFQGRHLFVNVDAEGGELRVEALDRNGRVVRPFSRGKCIPIGSDKTLQPVHWEGAEDLSSLAGKTVRLRFHLVSGRLFAFWVSPDASGASYGYVAAGGPGYKANLDDAGRSAYAAAGTQRLGM